MPTDVSVISINCSGPGKRPKVSKLKMNINVIDGPGFPALSTNLAAVVTAVAPLTNGVVKQSTLEHVVAGSDAYPASVANRGQKYILTSVSTINRVYTATIPAATALSADLDTDHVTAVLTSANWAPFKTAWENFAKAPGSGEALTLTNARLGGRTS